MATILPNAPLIYQDTDSIKTWQAPTTLLELVTSYMTLSDLDSTHEEKGYTFDINNGLITKIYQKDEICC